MPNTIPSDSVGIIEPQKIQIQQPLLLECGKTLSDFTLVYETYGRLNAAKSNAVLICHALSSDHHAAGYHSPADKKPGWWDAYIGPGKPFDTDQFFFVCPNNLGGCKGSTGPSTKNPETGRSYGLDFPVVTVKDWVKSQRMLREALGIEHWAAVLGGSLGGMQVMQWAIDYPDDLSHALVIAAASKLTAQNIAFNEVARQAIRSDPDFNNGDYYDHNPPRKGLMLARMLGHIMYLSDDVMDEKFGRELRKDSLSFGFDIDFQVESYLHYQGSSFVDRFDANTYLFMTRALDYFDPAADFNDDLSRAFAKTRAKFLVVAFTTDWRFPVERSQEIVKALLETGKCVSYAEISSQYGHDGFLIPISQYIEVLRAYMQRVGKEINNAC